MSWIVLVLLLLAVAPAQAETCLSGSSPPTYSNNQPVPKNCDLHGSQKVLLVDQDGNPTSVGGGSLTVEEEDGSPSVAADTLKFPNGTVTDNGGGSVSVTTGGAPTTATYLTQTANGTLSAEQALGALATGCMGSTTTTGVVATRTITGTANEITVTNGDCSGNPTLSLPSSIDLGGKNVEIPNSGTIPATCTVGQIYMDTGSTSGQRLFLCESTDTWVKQGDGGGAEADTLDTVFDRGKTIDGANSLANAVRIGDGTTPWCIYTDASDGPVITPCTDANVRTRIPTNFTWALYDVEGGAAVETIDPDAATQLGKYTYGSAYKPLKSIWFGAGSLSTDGTQCASPAEVTINSGPKLWTIICTDNDAATIYGSVQMPDSWDGGTVTFTHVYIQTAANTSALNGDIAAQCRGNGETPSSTWGTEVAIDDAGVTGSNNNDFTTSAAVTPAGTCAAGDMLYWRYQLDATGTTTAVATLHHVGFKMEYSVTSRSD
jgi:hypothetical protein